jgi:hypothetical protein
MTLSPSLQGSGSRLIRPITRFMAQNGTATKDIERQGGECQVGEPLWTPMSG